MDKTEKARPSGPARQSPKGEGGLPAKGSVFLWIVVAAVLFWIITAMIHRGAKDSGADLVRWQPHEKAVAAARKEGKPILYDFTADWCPPCHLLDSEGWGDSKIAATVNDFYLPTRVVDREREEGKNPPTTEDLHRRYSVSVFPTLVVADASGREIAKSQGYAGCDALLKFLEDSQKKAAGQSSSPP